MDIGSKPRPCEVPVRDLTKAEPRQKCALCCAAQVSAIIGGGIFLFSVPFTLIHTRGAIFSLGPRKFFDTFFFQAIPFSAVAFTHHYLLSEFLWSRSERDIFYINLNSISLNTILWTSLTLTSTFLWRRVLPKYYKSIRIANYDYNRISRTWSNKRAFTVAGTLSEGLSFYQCAWVIILYSCFWGVITVYLEYASKAQYAFFYGNEVIPYSEWCAPRWREWREYEVRRANINRDKDKALQQVGDSPKPGITGRFTSSVVIK